jgi:hypothetical protein
MKMKELCLAHVIINGNSYWCSRKKGHEGWHEVKGDSFELSFE